MSSKKFLLALTILILIMAFSFPQAANAAGQTSKDNIEMLLGSAPHLVTQIGLAPRSPNILPFGQNVTVTFKYNTTAPGGVRIFARPFTGGALTPNYSACPSPLYPVGSGSGSCTFTITNGAVTVDRIRFQIWNATQTTLLFQTFIPVNYQFTGDPNLNYVHSFTLSPATPNIMRFGQNVTLRFKYSAVEPNGVRIFARPMTGGALTPNYSACPSPLYPAGNGAGSCTFTIGSGAVNVDHIRLQMWNGAQTVLLFEAFVPVSYQFRGGRTLLYGLSLAPPNPNILMFGQNVKVGLSYVTSEPAGVRIFARPMTGAALTPNYSACPSPVYPTGSGVGSCTFTINSGTVTVTRVRLQVWNSTQTTLLFQAYIPVHFQFR